MFGIKTRLIRNIVSLNDIKSERNRINLEWWKRRSNLGDTLAVPIYEKMLEHFSLDRNKHTTKTMHLLTVGSLVGIGGFDAVVWGTGIHKYKNIELLISKKSYRKYDVRAVRGPITRWFLTGAGYDCPEIYGDPAILMPMVYEPETTGKKYPVSVIYHVDHKAAAESRSDINFIDIETTDYKSFIDEVVASEMIISSSLHGIILAETYGVPTVFLNDGMDDEIIKFYDWYLSTGRDCFKIAHTVDHAIEIGATELPDLKEMQNGLLAAFPCDLWEN